jgi:hypothetical protein
VADLEPATQRDVELVLRPNLSHCIETVARSEYERGLSELLRGAGSEGLAERMEILRLFLETASFGELRARSEKHLLAGKEVTFKIRAHEGAFRYELRVSKAAKKP